MAKKTLAQPIPTEQYPSLRSAMWLYLAATVAAAVIIIPLAFNIEGGFLNLLAVLVACLGLTSLAMFLTHVRLSTIFGLRPSLRNLIISLLTGLAVWVPASWLQLALYGYITAYVGPLKPPLPSSAEPWSIVLQAGIIIPFCEGLLFWAFIQRAAEGIGRLRAVLLTAVLYAAFATLLSGFVGISAFPALLVVGLAAGFATSFTGSAWCGIVLLAAYGAASPLLENTLFYYLSFEFANQFGPRWLFITVVTAFIAFILIQVLRVMGPDEPIDMQRARPRRFWWIPLIVCILFAWLVAFGEITLRTSRRSIQGNNAPVPTAVAPPVAVPLPSKTP